VKIIVILIFSILISAIFTNSAFAYLDPGTGSMLLQGLIAGILIVCTSVGIFWSRLKDLFSKLIDRKKE